MIDISEIWKALFAHKILILAALAAVALVMYMTPLGDIVSSETVFAAPGGGAKPAKPANPDADGDYGQTVKPAKPAKPAKP